MSEFPSCSLNGSACFLCAIPVIIFSLVPIWHKIHCSVLSGPCKILLLPPWHLLLGPCLPSWCSSSHQCSFLLLRLYIAYSLSVEGSSLILSHNPGLCLDIITSKRSSLTSWLRNHYPSLLLFSLLLFPLNPYHCCTLSFIHFWLLFFCLSQKNVHSLLHLQHTFKTHSSLGIWDIFLLIFLTYSLFWFQTSYCIIPTEWYWANE